MMHNKSNFHYLSLLQALFCNYSHTTTHTKPSIQVHTKGSPQINTSFPIVVHEVFLHSFHNWRPESDTFNVMYCLSSQQSSLWDFNSWRLLSAWLSSNKNVSKCSLNPFIFSILGFYRSGFHNSVYASQTWKNPTRFWRHYFPGYLCWPRVLYQYAYTLSGLWVQFPNDSFNSFKRPKV